MEFSEDYCTPCIQECSDLQEEICTKLIWSVEIEVLTAVTMECAIFWDITSCILVKVHRRFGGTY
jgi:hypothetical protein